MRKPRLLLFALILLLGLGGAVVHTKLLANAAALDGAGAEKAASAAAQPSASSLKVIAYYFHVTVRCATCRTIESYSKEALDRGFSDELASKVIEWRPVNVQLGENRHFVKDYRLFTRSLVLVKVREGKPVEWRNLDKVWELVGNREAFLRYVRANVTTYLGDN